VELWWQDCGDRKYKSVGAKRPRTLYALNVRAPRVMGYLMGAENGK
jgi:hypothetical protein